MTVQLYRKLGIFFQRRDIDRRGDKLFLDDSQNDFADTIASAYSVRPYHIPSVFTPLEWKEVKDNLDPSDFTIHTIQARLAKKGDLLKGLFDNKITAPNTKYLSRILNHPSGLTRTVASIASITAFINPELICNLFHIAFLHSVPCFKKI